MPNFKLLLPSFRLKLSATMSKFIIFLIILLFSSCTEKQNKWLHDRTYLILFSEEIYANGSALVLYEVYKIDQDQNKLTNEESKVDSNCLFLTSPNRVEVKCLVDSFKQKYSDSRIYLNNYLHE
jgi:hypothetical protein